MSRWQASRCSYPGAGWMRCYIPESDMYHGEDGAELELLDVWQLWGYARNTTIVEEGGLILSPERKCELFLVSHPGIRVAQRTKNSPEIRFVALCKSGEAIWREDPLKDWGGEVLADLYFIRESAEHVNVSSRYL
jgi:hypothetical protein